MTRLRVIDGGLASTRSPHHEPVETLEAAQRALSLGAIGAAAMWIELAIGMLRSPADCPCGNTGAGHGPADSAALAIPVRRAS